MREKKKLRKKLEKKITDGLDLPAPWTRLPGGTMCSCSNCVRAREKEREVNESSSC